MRQLFRAAFRFKGLYYAGWKSCFRAKAKK
jgi:hypothetical protein